MKIAAFAHERSACTTIRIKHPVEKIAKLKLADVHVIGKGDPETDKVVRESDVVFLGRAGGQHIVAMMETLKGIGKKAVYDLDDNLFNISPLSPHYKDFGIMPVEFDTDAGKRYLWQQGVMGFDVHHNRKMRKFFIDIIRAAACITVTTEPLAKIYRRMNDNVRVIPNALEFSSWEKPPIVWERDEVRLLYTGAANHQEDWLFVCPVLEELQREYPKLKIVLMGHDWKNIPNGLDYKRVETHGWEDIEAYKYKLQTLCCDIGIAPISKIEFNDCRSSIKWLEYSALKMATVATNYGPYKRDCKDGVNALLVEEKPEWKSALVKLIEDVPYRKALAAQALKDCKRDYDLDYVVDSWMSAFISVTGRN